jgi:branched-chain amino acid transport system substrate-binding protein
MEAAKQANSTDPDVLRDALAGLDFECFYGRIRFTEDGDGDPALLGPLLIQRHKGDIEVIHPEAAATMEPVYPAPAWEQRA